MKTSRKIEVAEMAKPWVGRSFVGKGFAHPCLRGRIGSASIESVVGER